MEPPVKHEVTYTAADIRAAIFDEVKRKHPDLVKGKMMTIELDGAGNAIVAKCIIVDQPPPSSAWD